MKKIYRWKFLGYGFRSDGFYDKFEIGKWKKVEGKLSLFENGFRCINNDPLESFMYQGGPFLAKVECGGDRLKFKDLECWRQIKVIEAYEWSKIDTLSVAVYVARLFLPFLEVALPNTKKHIEAVKAAINWLKNPSKENEMAAFLAAERAKRIDKIYVPVVVKKKIKNLSKIWVAEKIAIKVAEAAGRYEPLYAIGDLDNILETIKFSKIRVMKKIRNYFNIQVKKLKKIKN